MTRTPTAIAIRARRGATAADRPSHSEIPAIDRTTDATMAARTARVDGSARPRSTIGRNCGRRRKRRGAHLRRRREIAGRQLARRDEQIPGRWFSVLECAHDHRSLDRTATEPRHRSTGDERDDDHGRRVGRAERDRRGNRRRPCRGFGDQQRLAHAVSPARSTARRSALSGDIRVFLLGRLRGSRPSHHRLERKENEHHRPPPAAIVAIDSLDVRRSNFAGWPFHARRSASGTVATSKV